MAFYGCDFIFDGIPSWEYGLSLIDIGGITEDGKFATSPTKIYEDRTLHRHTPLHYGVSRNSPMKFSMTFGILTDNQTMWMSRITLDTVATWLTEHDEYKELEIIQPDMESMHYKCLITDLGYTTYGKVPVAFTCEVTCDGPYAYLAEETFEYTVSTSSDIDFYNRASCKYYKPKMEILVRGGSSLSIVNHSDNDREFLFSGLGSVPITIYIDNENEIITNSLGLNLYNNFNFQFFRLLRGTNELTITGNAVVTFDCEFPINIGG